MTRPAKSGGPVTEPAKVAGEPKYDAAISFLAADEKVASAIYSALSGLNVFFYPRNQEELIGTNGLESMRQPFLDARVVVVFYREPRGETPWTGVNCTRSLIDVPGSNFGLLSLCNSTERANYLHGSPTLMLDVCLKTMASSN
jgi:hypothetical protein